MSDKPAILPWDPYVAAQTEYPITTVGATPGRVLLRVVHMTYLTVSADLLLSQQLR